MMNDYDGNMLDVLAWMPLSQRGLDLFCFTKSILEKEIYAASFTGEEINFMIYVTFVFTEIVL